MRRFLVYLMLMAAAVPVAAGSGVTFGTDFVSEYVFRGASQDQGASLQPALSYRIVDTITANLWANVRLEEAVALSETDYSLQWTWQDISPMAATFGWIFYDRNQVLLGPETHEWFAGVELNLPGKPSAFLFYDFDANPGAYWRLAASHRFLLPDYRGTIDLSAAIGFDTGRHNGFNDARLTVAYSRLIGAWAISPAVDLHFPAEAVDAAANGFRPVFRLSASRTF